MKNPPTDNMSRQFSILSGSNDFKSLQDMRKVASHTISGEKMMSSFFKENHKKELKAREVLH